MNTYRKALSIYFITFSSMFMVGSLFSMERNVADLPLSQYIAWLKDQRDMTPYLELPDEIINSKNAEDTATVKHALKLDDSPNWNSFRKYTEAHLKSSYLADIAPSEVFLHKLSDLLLQYTDVVPQEVQEVLAKNNGSPETLKGLAEAFLKWYWSQDLSDNNLKALLRNNLLLAGEKVKELNSNSKLLEFTNPDQKTNPTEVINYYNAFISHAALKDFKTYFESYHDEPLNTQLLETDSDKNTALHFLAHKGSIPLAKLFHQDTINELLNRKNYDGNTPLHIALLQQHTDFALYLLNQPGILFEEENKAQQTPLSIATRNRDYRVAGEILKKKAGTFVKGWWY